MVRRVGTGSFDRLRIEYVEALTLIRYGGETVERYATSVA